MNILQRHKTIDRDALSLLYLIQFIAEQNLAFRGKCAELYESDNGNFLKCLEMIVKFDPIMSEHTRRCQAPGKKICPIILVTKIKLIIIDAAKKAKYYSIILDCTPDTIKNKSRFASDLLP